MSNEKQRSIKFDEKPAMIMEECKDRFSIVYTLFFFLGLVHILPWTFFITAHDYWMYKFRNTTTDSMDSKDRTTLQTEFSPSLFICLQLSTIAFLFLTMYYGPRYSLKTKLFGPLSVILGAFVLAAAFITVNTDGWQLGFFVLTMLTVAVVNAMGATFGMAVYSVLSNFERRHLGAYLNGQGLAPIVTSTLQLVSLAIGISTEGSALVYFWLGNGVIAFTLILMWGVIKYNKFYAYSFAKNQGKMKVKKMLPFAEMKELLKKVWPSVAIMGFWILTVLPVHTAITSLVVSEDEGKGEWNDVYFVPVITFLLPSIGDYIGRVAALIKIDVKPSWFVALSALRMVTFVPLLMLCNAQPRKHLPVAFPHDYQYIIIMAVFSLTNGYLLSTVSLIIPKLVPREKLEGGYHVYMVTAGILLGIFSFSSFITVGIL